MIRVFLILAVLFFLFFVLKFIRLFLKYVSSTKSTIDDLRNKDKDHKKKYGNVEEAQFREIPPEEEEKKKP